ncbi:MAG: GNAT family N-acetyltransferase [Deltaproteobacteria bacterium]|nr:MAG: GNAT family N-acetyltransferase [Deltaproteobacteria bacterium]
MDINSFLTGKRGVSLPFTDYCEPIVSDASQFRELFTAAVAFGAKHNWQNLELRGGEAFLPDEEPSECHYGHTLDLTKGPRRLFAGLRDSNRRNIKKAEKEKIEVTISASPDAVKAFCRLNSLTRRDHGLPPQPRRFFQCLYDHILSQGMGFIVLASLRGTAIAANVYCNFGDQILYKYGASDRGWLHLRANNLVIWAAIKWGCNHGYRSLCFGRTEPENEGLRQFKSGWGAREHLIKYYRYDLKKDAFIKTPTIIHPLFKKVFKKLPIPVLDFMGTVLYGHMG